MPRREISKKRFLNFAKQFEILLRGMLHQFREIRKWIRLITIFAVFTFAVSIFLHKDSAITQDLGRHLILGKIIWEQKNIPVNNLFSYTNPSFTTIDHHWGSQVIFYLIERFFSINGLVILKVLIITFALGMVVVYSLKKASFFSTFISTFLALEILRERTEIRPEIFGFLLFSIFIIILYEEKIKPGKKIWSLPFLSLIWVNLHISFILSEAFYLLFLIDRLILRKFQRKYLFLALLLFISTTINPFSLNGALYPFRIFDNYGYSIVENQSPFFLEQLMANPTVFYFKISTLIILLVTPILFIRGYFFEFFAVYLTGILSIAAIRNFPFFALSLIVPSSAGFTFMMQKIIIKIIPKLNYFWIERVIYLLIMSFLVWETYLLFSNKYYVDYRSDLRVGFGQVNGLKKTVDFFERFKLTGPFFNNFDIGSYLIYRLYPKKSVFVDSRPEAYPISFFQNIYIPMQGDETIWKQADDSYHFQTIIFGHTDATPWAKQFLGRILKDKNWALVYFDDYGVILIRKSLLSKLKLMDIKKQLRNYSISLIQENNQPDALHRLANFFRVLEASKMENLAITKAKSLSI